MPKVIAYMPTNDDMEALKLFLVGRKYSVDEYARDLDAAKMLLNRGDTLILTSVFDLGDESFKGFAKLAELTDKQDITVVTVKENFVLKDDVGSHATAGLYFLSRMIEKSTGLQEPSNDDIQK